MLFRALCAGVAIEYPAARPAALTFVVFNERLNELGFLATQLFLVLGHLSSALFVQRRIHVNDDITGTAREPQIPHKLRALLLKIAVGPVRRVPVVGHSKTDAGEGRPIPLNSTAFEVLVRWAGRYPDAGPNHYVFPWCENRQTDLSRPTRGWRTAWRHALKLAGFHCRFHDLRHTCITKLAEGQANDMTIMAIAGHVSKKMLERYSHIRMQAKRTALDGLVPKPKRRVLEGVVHQNVHQLEVEVFEASPKSLN
jgi:hypothetical protein